MIGSEWKRRTATTAVRFGLMSLLAAASAHAQGIAAPTIAELIATQQDETESASDRRGLIEIPETEVIGSDPEAAVAPPPPPADANPPQRSGGAPLPSAPLPSSAADRGGGAPVPMPAQTLPRTAAGSGDRSAPGQALPPGSVISATRSEIAGSQVGSSLTVISREAIRNSGQVEVAEVLRSVAGVDMNRSGGPGQLSSLFLRGANGNQTKVLLDGMSINDIGSAGGAFDFSFLSVDDIERIEVLRGPQSTLYGSDAIGGVVNIITARGSGPLKGNLSSMGGTYGTSRQAASVSGGNGHVDYSVGASYLDTDGFSASSRPPGNVENDPYRNGTLSGRFGWNATEDLNFDLVVRHTEANTGIDFGLGLPQDDPSVIDQENTFARLQATWRTFDGMWVHRFGGGYVQYDRMNHSPFGGPFYGRSGRFDWQQDMQLLNLDTGSLTATSGVDYHEEIGRNETIGSHRQDNLGGFVLFSSTHHEQLFLTAGGRWDDYTYFGDVFTYRTTARWEIPGTSKALHAALGTGFRAPALSELFDPFVGSANLRPERSKGWEAGLEQRFLSERLVIDTTYFRNDLEDLVIFDFGTFRLDNIGSGLASGVEVTSLYQVDAHRTLFANYTYTHTRNRDTDLRLLRRPRNKWSLGWNRSFAERRANVSLTANYVGDRLDTGDEITDAYWRVDVAGWYRLSDRWRLFSRIDNLLDEDYEETLGYNATRIAFYGGVEWLFGPGRATRR